MKRGEVYDARLDPVEGSEQRGSRPVVLVSRDAINESSPIVSATPCTMRTAPEANASARRMLIRAGTRNRAALPAILRVPRQRMDLGCHDVLGDRPGFGYRLRILSHSSNVKTYRPADQVRSLSERQSRRNAAGKIWDVRAETGLGLFEKNGVFHFSPACFRILLCVFRSRSMDGWPARELRCQVK